MKEKSLKWFKSAIDKARREYVRKRDLDFRHGATCITCPRYFYADDLQVGHIFSRTNDFSTEIGGDERAVNLQCEKDNSWGRGEGAKYCLAVDKKYGAGTCAELEKKRNTSKKWKFAELQALLESYKDKLDKLNKVENL